MIHPILSGSLASHLVRTRDSVIVITVRTTTSAQNENQAAACKQAWFLPGLLTGPAGSELAMPARVACNFTRTYRWMPWEFRPPAGPPAHRPAHHAIRAACLSTGWSRARFIRIVAQVQRADRAPHAHLTAGSHTRTVRTHVRHDAGQCTSVLALVYRIGRTHGG